MYSKMLLPALLINIFGTGFLASILCYYYGNWAKQHKLATFIALLSWWLPALILTLLPVDIASTHFGDCTQKRHNTNVISSDDKLKGSCRAPVFFTDRTVFLALWHFVYWSSQFLTWCLIPIMRSYSSAGDFTTLRKLRSALLDNLVYYASYLAILALVLVYLLAKRAIVFDLSYLKVLLITSANTWGLFLVVLFLGYGLIEFPRSLWMAGNPVASLHRAYFLLSKKSMELADEEERLIEIIQKVDYLKMHLPLNHPLQSHVSVVYKQAHESEAISLLLTQSNASESSTIYTNEQLRKSTDISSLNLKQLARLHKSLKTIQYRWGRARALYAEAVHFGIQIEDMNVFRAKRLSASSTEPRDIVSNKLASRFGEFTRLTYMYYFCYLRLWALQLLALLLSIASICVIWSECSFSIRSPTLSLVALVLQTEANAQDYRMLEVSAFLLLGYLSITVYFAVSRLRIFNYYRLVGGHHTDENSLLFCGALLCRLTPPLCLNFLGLAHMDSQLSSDRLTSPSHYELTNTVIGASTNFSFISTSNVTMETAYTQFMGHLDVIPFIARGFNIYFPIIILLPCVMTYFRLADRLLHQLGIPQLIDSTEYGLKCGTDPLTDDAILEGRLILRKERMILSRKSRTSPEGLGSASKLLNVFKKPYQPSGEVSSDRVSLLRDSDDPDIHTPSRRISAHPLTTPPDDAPIEYSESSITDQFSLKLNP